MARRRSSTSPPSSTVENYLKALHQAQASRRDPGALTSMGALASSLGVVPGTATTMVKALAKAGLVEYEPYAGVRLSPSGARTAGLVVRRHRLIELFLVEVLGMRWDEVHEEAELLEHAVSDRLVDRIDAMLGSPATDPHGDPIPGRDGRVRRAPLVRSLATCVEGEAVRVSRVTQQTPDFLQFVHRHRLVPGARVTVRERDRSADRVDVAVADGTLVRLGLRAASRVLVEPLRPRRRP
jgi:DtxR family Mn-dependent transcriptional regulator